MNSFLGLQPNPQLLIGILVVTAISRELQALAPEVLREGTVLVSEDRIRQWQTALRTAVTQVRQIPVPLIFPPPPSATFINEAGERIDRALSTLAIIPSAAPLTFPPQFGLVIISVEILVALLRDLQAAQTLLIRALQTAAQL